MRLPGGEALEKIQYRPGHLAHVPTDANVSGCLAGAPREMRYEKGSWHTLSLCGSGNASRGPGHRLPVAFLALVPPDGRWQNHGEVGPGRGMSGEGGCLSHALGTTVSGRALMSSPPLQEDA